MYIIDMRVGHVKRLALFTNPFTFAFCYKYYFVVFKASHILDQGQATNEPAPLILFRLFTV
jgi:hypothetical protein